MSIFFYFLYNVNRLCQTDDSSERLKTEHVMTELCVRTGSFPHVVYFTTQPLRGGFLYTTRGGSLKVRSHWWVCGHTSGSRCQLKTNFSVFILLSVGIMYFSILPQSVATFYSGYCSFKKSQITVLLDENVY